MKKTALLLLIALSLFSCKSGNTDKQKNAGAKEEKTAMAEGHKYGIKSGIIEYKTTVMGFEASQTVYFDNFGAIEAGITATEIMGIKSESLNITKNDTVYTIDLQTKTGTKIPVPPISKLNFVDPTDEMVADWNLKKEGTETFLDKECEKWSINNESMSSKGYYLIWKGIPFKMDAEIASMPMVMEVTSFQENADVPAEKFEIPEGVTFN